MLDRVRGRLVDRMAARLHDQVVGTAVSKPSHGAADWAAVTVAVVVHLFTVGCALVGLWLIFGMGTVFPILAGIALLGLAVLMRPRLGRLTRHERVVDPAQAPRLYGLANRVATGLGARPVSRIVLVPAYTAALGAYGLRRRTVLFIGYPLWNLLGPQERIALLGHEIGHSVNGDLRRGLLIGSSLRSLAELHSAMRPTRIVGVQDGGVVALAQAISDGLMWLLSWPILGLFMVQERLLAVSGQRSEYYADHLAAQVAGSSATRSTLAMLRLAGPCMRALNTSVIRRDPDIWAASRTWLTTLTEAERAEMSARADAQQGGIDATHPPTRLRISAIDSRTYTGETLSSDQAETAAIDAELTPLLRPLTETIRAAAIG